MTNDDVADITCVLTGADGEDADDCTTHEHEPTGVLAALPAEQAMRLVAYALDNVGEHTEALGVQWDADTLDVLADIRHAYEGDADSLGRVAVLAKDAEVGR